MPHETSLITTIVGAIVLACVLGALAQRLRLPPLVGYLLAGIALGPFTPGFNADQSLANQLAEIGVILLLFGVGLHFSPRELLAVRGIAVPGAVAQIALATALGTGLGLALGWSLTAGVVFGLALSVASTVVLLRALQERQQLDTERGRIAVGWLIVEDLAMVLVLVLVPIMAAGQAQDGLASVGVALGLTLLKLAGFVAFMLLIGRRLIPAVLHGAAAAGSRELFRLTVLALALGIAYASAQFAGVSFALGAFFAGMLLSESPLSHQAAVDTLPLRDAFAVLFFVSVGMLFDPTVLLREPLLVAAVVGIIMIGKSIAAAGLVLAFKHPLGTALTIAASLAQVGEFSFILAGLGVALGVLPTEGRDLILAGALVSIMLNPLSFELAERLEEGKRPKVEISPVPPLKRHAVVVGQGRVGRHLSAVLLGRGHPTVAIDAESAPLEFCRAQGAHCLQGNATRPEVLERAGIQAARWLFLAIPNGYEAAEIADAARLANPELRIVARAHANETLDELRAHGVGIVVMGEAAIARGMLEAASKSEAQHR